MRIERFSLAPVSVRPTKAAAPKTILPDETSSTEPVKQCASRNETSDGTKRDEAKKVDSEG